MKKIVLILAFAGLFSVQAAHAQKYGHVNSSEILEVMPGIDSLQIKLQAFQLELQGMYESMMSEYQSKKDKFDREVGTMSSSVLQLREKELSPTESRSFRQVRKKIWRTSSMSWPSRSRTPSKTLSTKLPKQTGMPTFLIQKRCYTTVPAMTSRLW